jgi:hypothetical protein
MTWGNRSAHAEPSTMPSGAVLRLGLAALLACLGLAWQAQAAQATYGKVTIVKVNRGGDQTDAFTFHPQVMPSVADFSIVAGEAARRTFSVECNVDRAGRAGECSRWHYPALKVSELAAPGYALTAVECRHTQGTSGYAAEPTASSPLDDDTTVDLAARRIDLKVAYYEWVKCWVTNTARRPAVTIDKTGPATAVAGDLVAYRLDVRNSGDVPFRADDVEVGDALCQAPPALDSKHGDATPATLDPGETWTYACAVQTAAGQARVDNVAEVKATDVDGCEVGDDDEAVTDLTQPPVAPPLVPPTEQPQPQPPAQVQVASLSQAAPAAVTPGSARLSGLSGCTLRRTARATVSGRRIVRVTFVLDGRRLRTLTRPDGHGRWSVPLTLSRLPFGGHDLLARVQFASSAATPIRTLRLRFSRCQVAAARPQFTG